MPEVFEPIPIRYVGMDANRGEIELGALGQSLSGAARMLALTSNFIATRRHIVRGPALSVRVLAGRARRGSWELPAIIAPIVPILPDVFRAVSSHVVEHFISWTLAQLGGRPSEAEAFKAICIKAIEEEGKTSRYSIDAMRAIAEKLIETMRPPARRLVAPVGESCSTLTVGNPRRVVHVDKPMKDAIWEEGNVETQDERTFTVLFTELDTRNKTGKVSIKESGGLTRKRYPAVILDPGIQKTGSPYGVSLSERQWINVRAQMQLKNGDPYRIYVVGLAGSR